MNSSISPKEQDAVSAILAPFDIRTLTPAGLARVVSYAVGVFTASGEGSPGMEPIRSRYTQEGGRRVHLSTVSYPEGINERTKAFQILRLPGDQPECSLLLTRQGQLLLEEVVWGESQQRWMGGRMQNYRNARTCAIVGLSEIKLQILLVSNPRLVVGIVNFLTGAAQSDVRLREQGLDVARAHCDTLKELERRICEY